MYIHHLQIRGEIGVLSFGTSAVYLLESKMLKISSLFLILGLGWFDISFNNSVLSPSGGRYRRDIVLGTNYARHTHGTGPIGLGN